MIASHEYVYHSAEGRGRANVYAILGIIAVFLSLALIFLVERTVPPGAKVGITFLAELLEALSPLVIFHILLKAFDRQYWRHRRVGPVVFWLARSSMPPDLNGSYEGSFACFDPEGKDAPATGQPKTSAVDVDICQTWQRMSVICRFRDKTAGSESQMAALRRGPNHFSLIYGYVHEATVVEGKVVHKRIHGITELAFATEYVGWHATGTYYSEDLGSGTIELAPTVKSTT